MADTEIIKIINIKTDQAINSVKELKNYINDLKDDLVKTNKGSKEYEETLEEIAKAQSKLTEVTRDSKNAMNYAEGSYKALNQELVNLRNEYRNLSAEERNSAEVGGRILTRIQELDTELKSIDATMGQYTRSVGNYKSAIEDVTVTYQTQRQELKALRVALEQLDPASQEYITAFNRAAEITHNLTEQQEMLKYSSKDLGDQISNIRGIASNMAAGFSAVNAAMGLFGEKNEDVAKALLKVQQCMAIVQGLQGMDGLLKRTQGLSTAMKAWFTSTTQVTTALNAEAVATNTATVAQKGLNAAMKANPIGLVITAVMALVTVFTMFSGKIKDAIKNNEKLNNTLGKLKGFAAAAGSALKNYFLVPLKEIINGLGTAAKVMQDIFTGQWGKIKDDIKNGVENAKTIVTDAVEDIETSYTDAVQKHLTKRERMRAEDRAKELQELIEHNEAKEGSDWKYTEKGKEIYDEYFQNLAYQYKEDSDDYKKAVNQKLKYDYDYTQKEKKAQEDATKKAKEEAEKRKKAEEDAKKKKEQIEKDYQSKIVKNYGAETSELLAQYKERTKAIIEYYKNLKTGSFELDNFIKGFIKGYEKDVNKLFDESNTRILETKAILNSLNDEEIKLLSEGKYDTKSFKEALNKLGQEGGLAIEDGIIYALAAQTRRLSQEFNARVIDSITNSSDVKRKLNDSIIQLFEKTIIPDLNKELARLQNEIDLENVDLDLAIALEGGKENELAKVWENSRVELEKLNVELNHFQQIKEYIESNPELIPSDEYDKALEKINELNAKIGQANIKRWKDEQAINKTYFEKDVADAEAYTAQRMRAIQQVYESSTQTGNWWQMLTPVSPEEEKLYMDEIYNAQLEGLEAIRDLWAQRKEDETLSYEDRLEAEKNFNLAVMDIEDAQLEYEIGISEKRKEIVQQYVDMTKEAVGQIANLFGSLADIYEEDINQKVKNNEMSEEVAEKEFERVKTMRKAEVIINTLAGAIGAFLQASATYPPPYGQIIGGISMAAIAASGYAQWKKIDGTSRNGGNTSSSSASVPAPDTSYNYQPMYVANTTGQQDTEYLRNSLTETPIRAYVVESDITESQNRTKKRNNESDF